MFADIFTTATNATHDGIFLPLADLPGLELSDLSLGVGVLEGKLAYALLNSVFETVGLITPLGFPTPEKSDPQGTGTNRYTEQITLRIYRLLDLRTQTISLPSLPTTGTYQGQGGLTLTDIWPGAAYLETGDSSGGAGVLIPDAWLADYGATGGDPALDSRGWVAAFLVALNHTVAVRSPSVASAITRKTDPTTIRLLGLTIPAEWVDATNPTTGIAPADLPYLRLVQEAVAIEYEILTTPDTQTYEVRVATTA